MQSPLDASMQLRRQSGMWASSSTASHQLLPAHRPAPSPARLAQQVKVQTLYAVAMPLAERKAAASREEVALPRHHLEALYQSDTEPASCLWQSPLAFGYADSDALLRPELLRMAVMEKNESPASAKQAEEERRKRQDYYANVGDAIRTLREEIPRIFVQDLTYDIYREDVVFKDPRNTVKGKKNYKRIFRGLSLLGRLAFTRCRVDVKRIWQPEPNRISLRWQFHGIPRIPWEVQGVFDGVSQFKLDSDGKVYEHMVTNVVLRDPPLGISPLWTNLARIFSREPLPCPGINFEDLPAGCVAISEHAATQPLVWVVTPIHHLLPLSLPAPKQRQDFLLE